MTMREEIKALAEASKILTKAENECYDEFRTGAPTMMVHHARNYVYDLQNEVLRGVVANTQA